MTEDRNKLVTLVWLSTQVVALWFKKVVDPWCRVVVIFILNSKRTHKWQMNKRLQIEGGESVLRKQNSQENLSKARLSKLHDIRVLQTKNPAMLNTPVTDAGRDYSALWAESLLRASEQSSCNAHSNPTCAAYEQGSSRLRAQQLTNLLIAQRQRQILPFFPPSLTLPPSHPPWKGLCRASNPAALKPSRLCSLDDCLPFKTTTWQTEKRARGRGEAGKRRWRRGEEREEGKGEFQEKGAGEWCAELPVPILLLLCCSSHLFCCL